ncbi:hypothetical protein M9H77_13299 [Catharanthus roseus]|uniref:Uncharacterized protein n=1 Tax=Catharanthus roseus TaxID=4058 RepID=A0ACC0BJQ2_CATRO|nr:hypothetical protein M9H77_13299 [Catharanthus roseus]
MVKLLTPLCIMTKVSQMCTSPMDPGGLVLLFSAFLLRTFSYILPPYYSSDPPNDKLNSALLLSRSTYPPRDSFLLLPTSRHHLAGSYRYQQQERNNQMETATNYGSWPRQRPKRRGDWSNRARLHDVIPPLIPKFGWYFLFSGERSQFATENKTVSERTFFRFFSTKHRSLRITLGRYLTHPENKESFTMMGVPFFPSGKNEMNRGPFFFFAACSSDLQI